MTQPLPPSAFRQSIATRLFRISFAYYALAAIALTALLIAGEFVSTRAAIQREMVTYEHAFDNALANALWAMDGAKLETIAAGMVEIPEIAGVRIVDATTNHLFVIAMALPQGTLIGRNPALQDRWSDLADQADIRHSFDITYRHATGASVLGRVELLSHPHQMIERIKGQTTLIVTIALFKEAILWGIFLLVSRRLLVRPLSAFIAGLDAANPEALSRITLPPAIAPIIAGTELMVVQESFNALSDRVHDHQSQLLALNSDLENQIAERTRALEESNRHLRDQTQRLSASNTELEQFAYVASHDLRQPLRMVSSYLSLLERRYGGQLDSEAHTFIGYARDGATRMDRLILDLLSLSRIGRTARPFEAIALSAVMAEALAILDDELNEAGITIQPPADLPMVLGDTDELIRLLTNLIGNAVKYRSPDRQLDIAIGWHPDETGAPLLWIRDNGIGFDGQDAERVFQIFQRLHTVGSYEGTGIGLAICKKIVERHGGHIWVHSTPGAGSTFFFTLGQMVTPDRVDGALVPA